MEKEPSFQHSESVVLHLGKPLLKQGSTICADNFYSLIPLSEKTYYCGTVRKNRKFLSLTVTKAKLKKGEISGQMNSNLVKICNWKDKRNVMTLSTVPGQSGELVASGRKNRNGMEIMKPQSVLDYNEAKMGVDK